MAEIIDNADARRFEMTVEGYTARAEYIRAQNKIYLTHTEVPTELEGQGVGSRLIGQVLARVAEEKLELVPLCPFVVAYLKKHPEWQRLVWRGVRAE